MAKVNALPSWAVKGAEVAIEHTSYSWSNSVQAGRLASAKADQISHARPLTTELAREAIDVLQAFIEAERAYNEATALHANQD